MTFHHLLDRIRRVWRWSVVAAIGFFVGPLFAPSILFHFVHPGGMYGLEDEARYFRPEDAFHWSEWLLFTGMVCCLASAVVAFSAGATYLMGKKLPDDSEIV
jgi:hypothetical protein